MKDLLRADFRRLYKNIIFIAGCIAAFVITWYYTANGQVFGIQKTVDSNNYMIFISAGIFAFFSVFPGLFQGVEYADGVIKNKIIVGFSQKQIYISQYITLCVAMLIMGICWLAGGLVSGGIMNVNLIKYIIAMLLFNMAYIAIMSMVCMRITKMIIAVGAQIVVFQMCFNATVMISALIEGIENKVALSILRVMVNIIPMGQWISNTSIVYKSTSVGFCLQLVLSIAVIIAFLVAGTFGINKRNLK